MTVEVWLLGSPGVHNIERLQSQEGLFWIVTGMDFSQQRNSCINSLSWTMSLIPITTQTNNQE